jgi:D-3-phosphoglycerate dehydrogenase
MMSETRFKVMRVEDKLHLPPVVATVEVETEELARVNADLLGMDCKTEDEIIEAAKDADALLIVFARITRQVLSSLPKLKVAVRYGIGYDTIDVDAATDNNVIVVNIPDFCIREVSDHAMSLLLACSRLVLWATEGVKQGRWFEVQTETIKAPALFEQTLGLVGCGNIGRLTAQKAQCFGLKTIGYDPYLDKSVAEKHGITLVSLPELLKEADYVSLHTPLYQETRKLIGEKELKQMKPTAYLINTSRGGVVDEAALIRALREKWITGAGLDVFEMEPIELDNPLLKMDNVVLTPHCAANSSTSLKRLKLSVAQEAARVLTGKWPRHWVNKDVKPKVDLVKEE